MLKVSLLGTPRIEQNGEVITFPYKRADALFYYMLVKRNVTRQQLVALLWENCDEQTGLKNLRNTLYTLKKVLGSDFLLSPQKAMVAINPQWEIDCDYDKFLREENFSVYGGPFLQGVAVKHSFAYEEWLSRTRETLSDRYLANIEKHAKASLQSGDIDAAIHWATEYLREDSLNENMTVFLMGCYDKVRQYAKSAQVYQKIKSRLGDEFGVDPMESTTVFYYEIMNRWNDAVQVGTEQEQHAPVPIGRENFYASLRAAADSFGAGMVRRCSQLFMGGVGSGKSVLIDHFLRESNLSQFLVLRCSCLRSEEDLFLQPWDRILLPVLTFISNENIAVPAYIRERLGQTFAAFRSEKESMYPSYRQWNQGLEDAVLQLMAIVARKKKILLIVEDTQWMDRDSLHLTDTLLRHMEGGGVMLVITCRDDCTSVIQQTWDRAVTDGLLRHQQLNSLTLAETTQLLVRELGQESADQLKAEFYQETGGNLELLTALVAAYRRNECVEDTLNAMGDILTEGLTGLAEQSNQVAELISVFQNDAPQSILLEVMRGDMDTLIAGIEELQSHHLIEERHMDTAVTYRFTHRRIAELVYDRLTFFQRQPLHLKIAQILSIDGVPKESIPCRQIARHFRLAGEELKSLEYRIWALELESQQSCEIFPMIVGTNTSIQPFVVLEQELHQIQKELSALQQTRADGVKLGQLDRMMTLIGGRLALFCGNIEEGRQILGVLSASGEQDRDRALMVRACYLLASSALMKQEVDWAERYTATGMRLLERSKDSIQQTQFQRLRGSCFCLRGAYDKSNYYLNEALDTLEQKRDMIGREAQLSAVYFGYGRWRRQTGDYAGACQYFKKALALVEGQHCPGVAWIYVHYGRTAFMLDDHVRARELFAQGYQETERTGELWGRTAAAAFVAMYQAQDGDYEGACKSLLVAQDCHKRLGAPFEGAILCFVSMRLCQQIEKDGRTDTELEKLLLYPVDSYARQGVRMLSAVPDVFETDVLSKTLRDGITTRQRYHASELYSKNRHFMTE